MTHFFSCDWGTSSFRLRLVEVKELRIIKEVTSDYGITSAYKAWQDKETAKRGDRCTFYLNILKEHIQNIEGALDFSVRSFPVLISGMASSSIGMEELSYASLPFQVDGSNAVFRHFPANEAHKGGVFLISGVRAAHDVMRGEETQLVGACDRLEKYVQNNKEAEQVFVFPGTHSKHIYINNARIREFKTFMTGEYFDLLRHKSILSHGVSDVQDFKNPKNLQSFKKGVLESLATNLLNATFKVRANHLFGYLDTEENSSYLSGLLIGHELRDLIPLKGTNTSVYLVGESGLLELYKEAILEVGLKDNLQQLPLDAAEAVVRGQLKIYRSIIMKNEFNNE